MLQVGPDGLPDVKRGSPLTNFHLQLKMLAESSSCLSKSKIKSVGDAAIESKNYPELAKYFSLYEEKCDESMKLPIVYICDYMFRSADKNTHDASALRKGFAKYLMNIYFFAKRAFESKSHIQEKVDKCFRIWQEKKLFNAALIQECYDIYSLANLVDKHKFLVVCPELNDAEDAAKVGGNGSFSFHC